MFECVLLAGVESQLGNVQAGDSPLQLNSPIPGFALPQLQQGTPAQTASAASTSTTPASRPPPVQAITGVPLLSLELPFWWFIVMFCSGDM